MLGFFLTASFSLIPVPKREPGIHFGPDTSLIAIEVFCDSVCPDCANTWPIVESVLSEYPTQVSVQLHFIALPSHTWAYPLARGVFAVNAISAETARQVVHGLYVKHEQNQFTASALKNTPESKVTQSILNYLASTYAIDRIKLEQAYNSTTTVQTTRIDFKYAFLRHIPGTPTVYINGAQTELNENSKLSDWSSQIKALL
jgi:predicted DsbA family dithiol-disulfide isomerase